MGTGAEVVKIICPACPGTLGELHHMVGLPGSPYAVIPVKRGRQSRFELGPDGAPVHSQGPRRTVTGSGYALDEGREWVLECRRGHRTRPLLAAWFYKSAVPALDAGYPTVTVNPRDMARVVTSGGS